MGKQTHQSGRPENFAGLQDTAPETVHRIWIWSPRCRWGYLFSSNHGEVLFEYKMGFIVSKFNALHIARGWKYTGMGPPMRPRRAFFPNRHYCGRPVKSSEVRSSGVKRKPQTGGSTQNAEIRTAHECPILRRVPVRRRQGSDRRRRKGPSRSGCEHSPGRPGWKNRE